MPKIKTHKGLPSSGSCVIIVWEAEIAFRRTKTAACFKRVDFHGLLRYHHIKQSADERGKEFARYGAADG